MTTFKDFIYAFDNWNGITVVNDNNLNCIIKGKTSDIAERKELHNMEVVSFGFYENELCIRVRPLIAYDRLLDIAMQSLSALYEAEPIEAMKYFKDVLCLSDSEMVCLGIPSEIQCKETQ